MNAKTYNWENEVFVVMPIGEQGTEIAKNFDQIYHYVIKEAVKGKNLHSVRADEIPGSNIVEDIYLYLDNCPIVIADLTGQNPNFLYEVGYRHCTKGKTILLAQNKNYVPFNLAVNRVIIYDITCPKGCHEARKAIEKHLDEILEELHVGT